LKRYPKIILTVLIIISLLPAIVIPPVFVNVYAPRDFNVYATDTDSLVRQLLLKGVKSDNRITEIPDFKIQLTNLIRMQQGSTLHVFTSDGEEERIERILITNEFGLTGDLTKIGDNGWPLGSLNDGLYLIDAIVNMPEGSPNGQRGIYETVLIILSSDDDDYINPNEAILRMEDVRPTIEKLESINDDEGSMEDEAEEEEEEEEDKDKEEPSICYFDQTKEECQPDENGNCPNDWPLNGDGNCHPGGKCPTGFIRVDDDETGTCYEEDETFKCESNAIVLDEEDCGIYDPDFPVEPKPKPELQSTDTTETLDGIAEIDQAEDNNNNNSTD